MANRAYTGSEFVEGFFFFAGLLWLFGALFFISAAAVGANRAGNPAPASNQTPIAASRETQ